jgi:hypothetical protein
MWQAARCSHAADARAAERGLAHRGGALRAIERGDTAARLFEKDTTSLIKGIDTICGDCDAPGGPQPRAAGPEDCKDNPWMQAPSKISLAQKARSRVGSANLGRKKPYLVTSPPQFVKTDGFKAIDFSLLNSVAAAVPALETKRASRSSPACQQRRWRVPAVTQEKARNSNCHWHLSLCRSMFLELSPAVTASVTERLSFALNGLTPLLGAVICHPVCVPACCHLPTYAGYYTRSRW